jgi:hypothetical protein
LTATAAFLLITWQRHRAHRAILRRGLLIALGAAAVIGVIVFAAAELLLNGGFNHALSAAAYVAGGFLWLNVIVLVTGLWFKPAESWSLGAMLSTPVILAAIGFGYAAYRAMPVS